MTDLPLADVSFDLVLAALALHNLHPHRRRELALREAIRVLRPGGRLRSRGHHGHAELCVRGNGCRTVRRTTVRLRPRHLPAGRVVTASRPSDKQPM
ncbi:MAG: methyltransferase domain-containing protein [Nocardioidaceae bacterium]